MARRKQPECPYRVGHGYDIHRLRAGRRLVVAGQVVSRKLAAVAHSDGDVACHAIVDALLGAIGQGDIGQHFPNSDPKWKGVSSDVFVKAAVSRLAGAGWRVASVDLTILAERPRLAPFRDAMRRWLEAMLDCPVNVKFGTHEGCDAIGRGQAIAAHAVALVMHESGGTS